MKKLQYVIFMLIMTSNLWANEVAVDKAMENFFKKIFTIFDIDKDAKLSLDEFVVFSVEGKKRQEIKEARKTIAHCDKNNNGKIDLKETSSKEDMFKHLDINSFEKMKLMCPITREQILKIDKNKDSSISEKELVDSYSNPLSTPFGDVASNVPENFRKKMPPQMQIIIAISNCDPNKDKKLSIKEAKACDIDLDFFKKFDIDKSNTLEIKDLMKVQYLKLFNTTDINKNNSLEVNEFVKYLDERCKI